MTSVCLSDLINLSFGSCELRSMKFQILEWCLKVIIQQLDLGSLLVEFRGDDSLFIQNELRNASEEVRKKLFTSIIDEQKEKQRRSSITEYDERRASIDSRKQVVIVEDGELVNRGGDKSQGSSSSSSAIARIEGRLRYLQAQIDSIGAHVLPSDKVLIERVREVQESKPVTELLQTMKITKRMTGAEEEIDRIASLLELVAKEYNEIKKIMNGIKKDFGQDINQTLQQLKVVSGYINNIRPREAYYHTTLKKGLMKNQEDPSEVQTGPNNKQSDTVKGTVTGIDNEPKQKLFDSMDKDVTGSKPKMKIESDTVLSKLCACEKGHFEKPKKERKVKNVKSDLGNKILDVIEPVKGDFPVEGKVLNKLIKQHEQIKREYEFLTVQINTLADFAEIILSELVNNEPNIEVLKEKIREVHLNPSEYKKTKSLKREVLNIQLEICYRIDSIEGNISKYAAKFQLLGDMQDENIRSLSSKVENLEKDMEDNIRTINVLKLNDSYEKEEIMERMGEKLTALDEEVEIACAHTNTLLRDMKSHEVILKKLEDDITTLKAVKLDRFEFEELLSDKANVRELDSKVSQDQFIQAYRFLTNGFEKTGEKISSQSLIWKKLINNLEKKMDNKLSLDDFHELSMKLVTEIKQMSIKLVKTMYGEYGPPAHGAKTKFMKNLQCISCDRDVIMRVENELPAIPNLPKLMSRKLPRKESLEEDFSSDSLLKDLTSNSELVAELLKDSACNTKIEPGHETASQYDEESDISNE